MYATSGAQANAQQALLPSSRDYPAIPFSDITRSHAGSDEQLVRLQHVLHLAWHGGVQVRRLDLTDMGLQMIYSTARLVPRSVESLVLDDNPHLMTLPNDLPGHLRNVSVRNASALQFLPDSLPHGLTMEVAGSGLTLEHIRTWAANRPRAGVRFTQDGQSVDVSSGSHDHALPIRLQPGWTASIQRQYERDRYGAGYVASRDRRAVYRLESAPQASAPQLHGGTFAETAWPQVPGPGEFDNGAFTLAGLAGGDHSDTTSEYDSASTHSGFDVDELALALAASMAEDPTGGSTDSRGADGQFEHAWPGTPLPELSGDGTEVHRTALAYCEYHLEHAMAFWLGEASGATVESCAIARQCVSHLYALEDVDADGNKRRPADEIVMDHFDRLNDFTMTLERIKSTASFSSGTLEEQARQRGKVADMLRLMATDPESCGTVLAAMKEASSTCADALATEGIDMVEAMCVTSRAIRENWTPLDFYRKFAQQIKREKVRAQVGDIVERMKQEYGKELMDAIKSDHVRATKLTFFRSAAPQLGHLVGDGSHVVRSDGTIRVRYPDPDEHDKYAATLSDRRRYVSALVAKKIDEIEVLSLCQNAMQTRGLLDDVQAGLYTFMHSDNSLSATLNVTSDELKSMAKSLRLGRSEVLAKMTAWEHWTDFLDRHGHLDDLRNDPQLKADEAGLVQQMNALRDTLSEFISDYAADHPEAGPDFALLNRLITAVGTPAVPSHELLRRGADNAITFAQKEKHVEDGALRLAQIESESRAGAAEREPDGRPDRHASRHHTGHHSSRRTRQPQERGTSGRTPGARSAAYTPTTEPATAQTFAASRLALYRSAMQALKAQARSPYEAALLRKTTALVTPFLGSPAPASAPAPAPATPASATAGRQRARRTR